MCLRVKKMFDDKRVKHNSTCHSGPATLKSLDPRSGSDMVSHNKNSTFITLAF